MFNTQNFSRKTILSTVGNVLSDALFYKLFADEEGEETPPAGTGTGAPSVNIQELIAQARKEEKDKLYPQIKKLKEDNQTAITNLNSALLESASLRKQIAELQEQMKSTFTAEEKAKLEKQITELQAEVKKYTDNPPPTKESIRAELDKEYEVKLYRTEKLAEKKDAILPMFVDSVSGKTKEEIDASVEKAVKDTEEAKKFFGMDANQPPQPNTPPKRKSTPPANPPSGVDVSRFNDANYIATLDPRSPEYKEFRKWAGLK
jgi:flagellar biosynthesis chaperone FliJ